MLPISYKMSSYRNSLGFVLCLLNMFLFIRFEGLFVLEIVVEFSDPTRGATVLSCTFSRVIGFILKYMYLSKYLAAIEMPALGDF